MRKEIALPSLFDPLSLRSLFLRNRIVMPPMCQYACGNDGIPTNWHKVHYGSRAVGGIGLLIVEATAVWPEGRISPNDCGLWNDEQAEAFASLTSFLKAQGATPAVQLAHAGRKASTLPPQEGEGPLPAADPRRWETLAPSALAFAPGVPMPRAMTTDDIGATIQAFAQAAARAVKAGFEAVEIHSAHGYLLHEFLSPLTNKRRDSYGGSLENRMRFPLAVAEAVRKTVPSSLPVLVRLSATDWVAGGLDVKETVAYVRALKEIGVDMIDVSTGGLTPDAKIPVAPGFQVPFAATIRQETGLPVIAVGVITESRQAQEILDKGQADAIGIARAILGDPHWPLRAAQDLGYPIPWPAPYKRGKIVD